VSPVLALGAQPECFEVIPGGRSKDFAMRPWKIILSAAISAIIGAAAVLRFGLSPMPGEVGPLLSRLPAAALMLIGVYALVGTVLTAGGLIATAVNLRRGLGRTDATSQAAAALEWIAAFDATALHALVPRPVGALPKSGRRGTTILLDARFDPRIARAEASRVYYLWLARTHALSALVGLAAIAALGFAQSQGGVSFLPQIPTGSAALVLAGLVLLAPLGRFAIDVTIDPLIDAMSRLPWEQADAGQLRYALDLLGSARNDATSGRSVAGIPSEAPERFAAAIEDGGRVLAAAGERLSAVAETLGAATRSSSDAVKSVFRDAASIAESRRAERAAFGALQAAVEALTAELQRDTAAERLAGILAEDRHAIADAVERIAASTDAIGVSTRASGEALQATLRESVLSLRNGAAADDAGATELRALQGAVEALTAELQQIAALFGAPRAASAPATSRGAAAAPDIGRELRKLLQEI
jgi:hypothetical protein